LRLVANELPSLDPATVQSPISPSGESGASANKVRRDERQDESEDEGDDGLVEGGSDRFFEYVFHRSLLLFCVKKSEML
jgi:hypothetical protein